jgi:hypothetical protein
MENVRLCNDKRGDTNVNLDIDDAARKGYEAIMRLFNTNVWHAADVNLTMAEAARNGHEAIVRLYHDEWGRGRR